MGSRGKLEYFEYTSRCLRDPVERAANRKDNLGKLRFVYIDCGTRDEFSLHWGARALVKSLEKLGLKPHHEEFDDTHRSVGYRLDVSLPLLARALQLGP